MTTPTSGNSTAETGLPPNYYTHKLANGLQLVGQRMPSLASVTFGIQVAAGLRDEPEERGGLTNLLSDMMFQGTETRDVRQLTDEFEAIGARRGAETGTEFARYSAQIVGDTPGEGAGTLRGHPDASYLPRGRVRADARHPVAGDSPPRRRADAPHLRPRAREVLRWHEPGPPRARHEGERRRA